MLQWLNLKTMVHVLMLIFAGASFFNVRAFFVGAGHDDYAALALGAALGGALVIVASMLTHTDKESDPEGYRTVLRVGVGLGLVSGYLQAAEYAQHLALIPAVLLGFAIPLLGEVGLAFAYSAYSKARERERFRSVSLVIEGAAATVLDDAIRGFDPSPIRKHVDRTLTGLLRQAVDHAGVKASAFYVRADAPQLTQELTPLLTDSAEVDSVNTGKDSDFAARRAAVNDARRKKALRRQDTLLKLLRDNFNGQSVDALNKTELGGQMGVTRQTVGNDLEALQASGRLVLNGHVDVRGKP